MSLGVIKTPIRWLPSLQGAKGKIQCWGKVVQIFIQVEVDVVTQKSTKVGLEVEVAQSKTTQVDVDILATPVEK